MSLNHTPRRAALGVLAAAALVGAVALPARAQDELVLLETARTATFMVLTSSNVPSAGC
jgi:hypothetical protein